MGIAAKGENAELGTARLSGPRLPIRGQLRLALAAEFIP